MADQAAAAAHDRAEQARAARSQVAVEAACQDGSLHDSSHDSLVD
ncbi:hypothetical protein GCM10023225_03380 [Kineococcus glutinatus]|uniref:Uncharacterized protein n=1 Tax=Kineococcus glutinatus TaxID=1070872 RepID=A0ABP9H7V3_9ACTN